MQPVGKTPYSHRENTLDKELYVYEENFKVWKARSEWSLIIRRGKLAVHAPQATVRKRAGIHAELANSYFRENKFLRSKKYAQISYALNQSISNSSGILRAQYLLSACVEAAANNVEKGLEWIKKMEREPDSISAVNLSLSYKENTLDSAFSDYKANVQHWKANSEWKRIAKLGKLAIHSPSITLRERVRIHIELSSCYFKMSKYKCSTKHARISYLLSHSINNPSIMVEALDLLSICARAANNFKLALQWIEKAKNISGQVPAGWTGKIHFNEGSFRGDLKGEYEKALQSLEIALQYFPPHQEGYNRTIIRKIEIFLMAQQPRAALDYIHELEPQVSSEKVLLHLHYLKIQVLKSIGDIEVPKKQLLRYVVFPPSHAHP